MRAGSFSEHNSLWHGNHQYLVKELERVSYVGRKGSYHFLTVENGSPETRCSSRFLASLPNGGS